MPCCTDLNSGGRVARRASLLVTEEYLPPPETGNLSVRVLTIGSQVVSPQRCRAPAAAARRVDFSAALTFVVRPRSLWGSRTNLHRRHRRVHSTSLHAASRRCITPQVLARDDPRTSASSQGGARRSGSFVPRIGRARRAAARDGGGRTPRPEPILMHSGYCFRLACAECILCRTIRSYAVAGDRQYEGRRKASARLDAAPTQLEPIKGMHRCADSTDVPGIS
jgi:hypothetical protein